MVVQRYRLDNTSDCREAALLFYDIALYSTVNDNSSMDLDPLQTLSSDCLSLFTSGNAFSDVTFCIEGRQLHAHRCILAARSPFFRLMFSSTPTDQPPDGIMMSGAGQLSSFVIAGAAASAGRLPNPSFIPVDVVGYNAFVTLLQFLYSGQLIVSEALQGGAASRSRCPHRACSHTNCNYGVDLSLELIHAAKFFGVDQLSDLVQTKLAGVLEGVSVENLMRILVVAKKQKLHHLWPICSELVMNSGLGSEVLRRYLPREVLSELAEGRLQRGYANMSNTSNNNNLPPQMSNSPSINSCNAEEQRILRLQQALDCMDVELVRLMVMGEGLNLDKAHALHYSVANCNREVVKALLELGVVDVNYGNGIGRRTALHLAAEMGNAEMIAVLLDHHADPNAQTEEGFTALDIVRFLIKASNHDNQHANDAAPPLPLCKADQKRIHLCIELLQSAAAVAVREEAAESSCVTQGATQIISNQINEASGLIPQTLIRDDRLSARMDHHPTNRTGISGINHDAGALIINAPADHQQMNYGYLFSAYPELINLPTVTDSDQQQGKSTTITGSSSM